jgi:predicted PurR-regulated permease PerM
MKTQARSWEGWANAMGPPRGVVVLVGTAAAVVTTIGLKAAGGIVGPVFLALVLTIAAHPLRRWLSGLRLPSWAASLVCAAVVYLGLLGLVLSLVLASARFATLLPGYEAQFNQLVGSVSTWLSNRGVGHEQVLQALGSFDLSRLTGVLTGIVSGLLSVVSDLLFILLLALFMTMDAGTFPRQLERAATARPALISALARFASGTRRYLVVSTVFGLIVAAIDTAALGVMGIPVPILWGLLAFITNYIPNIGFVIGLVPPAILGLLQGGPGLMLAVIAAYCVINFVIQSVIQPRFVGDAVGLSTTLTFLSLVFWAWVLGALGALLAIPLTLLAKALLVDSDPQNAWLVALLSNRDGVPQAAPGWSSARRRPGRAGARMPGHLVVRRNRIHSR